VILGAGAAGLAAGRELSRRGMRVTILEARQRLGGRIFTIRNSPSAIPIELGAEFVHGEPAETLEIVHSAGLGLHWVPDNHRRARNGKFTGLSGFWDKADSLRRDIAKTTRRSSKDVSLAEYLEKKNPDHDSRLVLLNYAEGFNAAHSTEISAKSLALEDEEDTKQFRLTNGYDHIVDWLRTGLDSSLADIRLNTIATQVQWLRGEVIVRCESQTGFPLDPIRAHSAVITIPAALLRAKSVRFLPELPEKDRALEKLGPAQVFKVVLQFRESFWRSEKFLSARGLDNEHLSASLNFIHTEHEGVPVWWTSLPFVDRTLTAWAGGPKAETLLAEDMPTRINKTLAALSNSFGVKRSILDDLLEFSWFHDWQDDPFSRAAYTYVRVGGMGAADALARPVEQTLFFAGEATDLGQMGTVAGALRSGKRAAEQLLSSKG
jgi:monoamine oxidase